MIYVKIYVDKDENGEDMLVFDSATVEDNTTYFTVAGKKKRVAFDGENYIFFQKETRVIDVENVAISAEAKELFSSMLNDKSVCEQTAYGIKGDFTVRGCYWGQYGWDGGEFAYCPPEIRNGITAKMLRKGEHFTVTCVFSAKPLEYMTPCDNEMLKSLDISEPIDETVILDAYYGAMRAEGKELSCDVDTIRKTDVRYLTEEQKEVIRSEYRSMMNRYDAQEWHYNGELLDDKIREELIRKYHKIVELN